ncbi:hypothetical protein T484DRAFT_1777106 [Baffinella frigidus]|nr:hypothetical protein T484DRAFT_1777106 [Cryptophyta sp. CCMP2293]
MLRESSVQRRPLQQQQQGSGVWRRNLRELQLRSKRELDEEEAPAPRGEKGPKPRHKTVEAEYIADYPKIDFDRMERVRVSRDKLIENAREPFFSEFVQGLYCRINLGTNDTDFGRNLGNNDT